MIKTATEVKALQDEAMDRVNVAIIKLKRESDAMREAIIKARRP